MLCALRRFSITVPPASQRCQRDAMDGKARQRPTARAPDREAPVWELQVGREIVTIWLDGQGIHFCQPESRKVESVLPWDIAVAMSCIPDALRRRPSGVSLRSE